MKDKFIKFLKKEGVYGAFMRNFENDPESSEGFDSYCKSTASFMYIGDAFMWHETPEWERRLTFWATINERWETYLKEYERASMPTDEEIQNAYINYQWALAASDDYHQGLEDGFKAGVEWLRKYKIL